jgi:hypothetical protein
LVSDIFNGLRRMRRSRRTMKETRNQAISSPTSFPGSFRPLGIRMNLDGRDWWKRSKVSSDSVQESRVRRYERWSEAYAHVFEDELAEWDETGRVSSAHKQQPTRQLVKRGKTDIHRLLDDREDRRYIFPTFQPVAVVVELDRRELRQDAEEEEDEEAGKDLLYKGRCEGWSASIKVRG